MALRPENTIAAFRHALELGVEVLEFDMNVTADDQIVLHHDFRINPAICAPEPGSGLNAGPIRLLPLRDVRRFDCGSRPPAAFPGQTAVPGAKMPTLQEFLAAVRGSRAELLGETKMAPETAAYAVDPAMFVDLICRVLKEYGVEDRFILQSGDYRTIDEMRKRNPRVRTCLLNARRFKPDYVGVARQHEANSLMLNSDDVDADGVSRLHRAGYQVYSSTADDPVRWNKYLDLKMDGILTNDPKGLTVFLKTHRSK